MSDKARAYVFLFSKLPFRAISTERHRKIQTLALFGPRRNRGESTGDVRGYQTLSVRAKLDFYILILSQASIVLIVASPHALSAHI
jgi:hypothetical protein